MDERNLLAAVCGKRSNYDAIKRIGVDAGDFGEAARCIMRAASQQYKRDDDLQAVDRDILKSQVVRRFGDGSMADSVMDLVATLPTDISGINVIEEHRLLRLARCATTLATLLATGQHGQETDELLGKYSRLAAGAQSSSFKARLTAEDFEDDAAVRIPLYPASLNKFLGGGVKRGHSVLIYGRPESAKTLFALNMAAKMCTKGFRVLYVANEEPEHDVTMRLLSRMSNMDIMNLRNKDALLQAFERAGDHYENWHLLHRAGITSADLSSVCASIKPDVVFVDQLKNLACKGDNRAIQLDELAQQVRAIGITHNCVTVSITQAGDSAEGKLILAKNDVDWSNTGIPGAVDVMIGIGVDQEYDVTNKRMLSIPKNKANGRHGNFPIWVDPRHTAVYSKKRA